MTTLLKILARLFGALVFLALLGLAIKNSGTVEVRFYFDRSWLAPVSLVILLSFAVGVGIGLMAALGGAISRRGQRKDR